MIRLRKAIFPTVLAAMIGCGGSSSVSNAAHLRFFDALSDVSNVRLYVGGHLYSAGSIGPSIKFGNSVDYGDVPSGTVSLVVNDYTDQNSAGDSSSLATLTSQTFLVGRSYTAVALLSGTTKKLVLFSDNSSLEDDEVYFRIVNASTNVTPAYVALVRKSDNTEVYVADGGLASGSYTGLEGSFQDGTGSQDYTLQVYSDSDMTNEIASTTISLTPGKAVTTFIYNKGSGSDVSFKSSTDKDANVVASTTGTNASTTATTGTTTATGSTTGIDTTGTTGTTATTGTTSTTGTTATTGTSASTGSTGTTSTTG